MADIGIERREATPNLSATLKFARTTVSAAVPFSVDLDFNFPNGTINDADASGISSTADSARQIQFGLKLIF